VVINTIWFIAFGPQCNSASIVCLTEMLELYTYFIMVVVHLSEFLYHIQKCRDYLCAYDHLCVLASVGTRFHIYYRTLSIEMGVRISVHIYT
jgi:hypothetical protein